MNGGSSNEDRRERDLRAAEFRHLELGFETVQLICQILISDGTVADKKDKATDFRIDSAKLSSQESHPSPFAVSSHPPHHQYPP